MSVFGENLKRFRMLAGLSGKEFAKKLNIPYNSYMNYENKDNEPKYAVLCNIADKLGVTVDELVRDHSIQDDKPKRELATSNEEHDAHFEKLFNLMASAGFLIKKDKKGAPSPKYGERILISNKNFLPPKVKVDYLNRMYLLVECILHQTDKAAHSLFADQLYYHFEPASKGLRLVTPAGALLSQSEKLFDSKIKPKSAKEIQEIIDGKAKNPLLDTDK